MKDYIERLEEIEDFYCSNGEVIPAEYFLQEPKGQLSLIPDYDDDVDIFKLDDEDEKDCPICGGDMKADDSGSQRVWNCPDCGHSENDLPLRN